jgi:ribosome recycling factor
MYAEVIKNTRSAMDKALEAQKKDLSRVRTGRATTTLLDEIRVNYYGTPTPISQVGTLAVPEARLITIQPWERNLVPEIEKAILKSDLGLNPVSDGILIRLSIPPLTEERRKEMVKQVRRMCEDTRVSIRTVRRDANEAMKKLEKDKEVSADELKRGEKEIQDLTDQYIKKAEETVAAKEKEIMEI